MKKRLFILLTIYLIGSKLYAEDQTGKVTNSANLLNTSNQTNVHQAPLEIPFPVVECKKYYFVSEQVVIDATKSIARKGRKIRTYSWKQSPKNPEKICSCKLGNKPKINFNASRIGAYIYYLTINDGKKSQPYKIVFNVVNKYSLISDLPLRDNVMKYTGNRIYTKTLTPEKTGNYHFKIITKKKI